VPFAKATVEDTAEIVVGGNVGRLNGERLKYLGIVGGEVALAQAHDMARRCVVRADGRVLAGIPDPRWT
jgi:hypothetical protein